MSSRVLSSAVVYHHPTILELPELLSQLWALWHGGFQLSLPGKQQHPFGQFHSRRQKDLHGSFADVGAPVLCLPVPLVQLGLLLQWLVGLIAAALLCQHAATVQGWAEQTALLADQWLVAQALWLVTAEPAGIKLHAEACHLLGWFMLNCLRLWSIASIWAWPVCAPVSGMIVVLGLVSGGLAGGLAACHDLLLLAAAPLALLHLAFSSLLRVHRMSIGRTWQMMRGQGQPRRRTPAAPPKPNPDPNHHPTAGVVYRLLANSESVHTVPSPSATYGPGASPCMPGNAGKSEAVDSGESSARHANQRIRQHGVHQNEEGGKTAAAVGKTAGQRNSSKQLADHRNPAQDAPKQWQRGDAACGMAKQGRLASNGVVAQVTAAATANKQVSHSHSMATQQLPRSHAAATHQLARAAQQSKVGATSQDLHSLWGQPDKARDEEVVVERLIVGVLLFVPLLALAPSTFAWHLLATTAHLGSVLVRAVIRTGVRLQLVNPALILLWWVGRPHDFLDVDAVQPLQPPPRPSFSRQLHARGISRSAARKVPSAPLAALISPVSQQGVLPEDPSCLVFDVEELQPQVPSAQHTATPTAGTLSGPAPSLSEVTTGDAVVPQTAGGRADPGPHELLLLAGALLDGYEKQLHMLALIASSLNLASPTENVSTYVTLLQLQPFVDERVVSSLIQDGKRS